jgi:hypothetical protein
MQCVTMGQKLYQKSTSITLHYCLTSPIRQTWARATFGSSVCWKEFWNIENFIRIIKLKRWLEWPGMTSHSMRSRASFTIGWTDLNGSLRTGESRLLNKDDLFIYVYWVTESAWGRRLSFPCIWTQRETGKHRDIVTDPKGRQSIRVILPDIDHFSSSQLPGDILETCGQIWNITMCETWMRELSGWKLTIFHARKGNPYDHLLLFVGFWDINGPL